jgi:hypothetical protein
MSSNKQDKGSAKKHVELTKCKLRTALPKEGRDSELEKNKIKVSYSSQPIFVSLISGLYCDTLCF